MKTSTLRTVDRVVGVPSCALLTLHGRLFGRRPATAKRRAGEFGDAGQAEEEGHPGDEREPPGPVLRGRVGRA
jgi:hypothetical protein